MSHRISFSVFILMWVAIATSAWGQAKKPTLMVIPSDVWCIDRGYSNKIGIVGDEQIVSDYTHAFQSDRDLRLVIAKISSLFADRGFTLEDLEQTLKSLQVKSGEADVMADEIGGFNLKKSALDQVREVARPDIILDLDFQIKQQGPKKYVYFVLRGLDSYTNKAISTASGTGAPSMAVSADILLQEAVVSHMDDFSSQLQVYFDEMFEKGREVSLSVRVSEGAPIDLYETYDFEGEAGVELREIIEYWLEDNTVNSRFSSNGGTRNIMEFKQVRIPLYNSRNRPTDAGDFAQQLRKYLAQVPLSVSAQVYNRGLGEAWVIIK